MRQNDGSELLGANDPRSATIGVIHVAPNDDRQSVLAAILTQDKLGRKQVAVVLPEDNKAFQRPIDFDGLKNMRRGLKAQIVFVAPSGPGPAEFARQRRFPVYSSLDSYARALQADGQGSTVIKRGWGFGRRQKSGSPESMLPTPPPRTNGVEHEPTHPLPEGPVPPSEHVGTEDAAQAEYEDEESHRGRNAALLGGAGLAAGLGLGAIAAGEHGHGSFTPPDEEDWEALPTPPAGTPGDNGSSANDARAHAEPSSPQSSSGQGSAAGPGIIAFPSPRPQGRITDKLAPIPPVASAPSAQPHPPVIHSGGRQRNSGKIAAVGAAGVAAGAGAAWAARGAGVGTPPPPTRTGGGAGGGAAASRRRNRRRLLALALILLTLLLIAGIALASPGGLGQHIFGPTSGATVTITPANPVVSHTYTIDAVPGGTTGPNIVPARLLFSAKSQSNTVNATGIGKTPGVQATGTLTFYNGSFSEQTVLADTVFTTSSGVQVENTAVANIPPATGNPPTFGQVTVAAIAVNVGTKGDIAAGAINQTCCSSNSSIKVANLAAFSGGQDPQTYTVVKQSDIDGFANPFKASLPNDAKADLTNQKGNYQFVTPISCAPATVDANPKVGQPATKVMVKVSVTCNAEVYDQQGAFAEAQASLRMKASQDLGASYILVGDIIPTLKQANVVDTKGTVALLIFAEGRWKYEFSDAQKKTILPNLIKGKSKSDAQTLLLQQPGVSKVSIDIAGGGNTLPTDPTQISIVIQPIEGFKGTPTPTTGPSTPTSPGGTATSGTSATPTPVNGNGSAGSGASSGAGS